MADSDKTLDLLIRLGVIGRDDAKAAIDLLREAGETTGKTTEKTKEAGKESEKSAISHRDLHKVLHLLAHESGPAAGAAMAGLFSILEGGSIGVGIFAVKQLIEALEQMKKKAEESALAAANVWIAQRDAAKEALDVMNQVSDKQDQIKTKYEGEQKLLDALIEQRKKLTGKEDTTGEAAKLTLLNQQLMAVSGDSQSLKLAELDANGNLQSAAAGAGAARGRMAGVDEASLRSRIAEARKTMREYSEGSASFYSAGRARSVLDELEPKLAQFEKDRDTVAKFDELKKNAEAAGKAFEENQKAVQTLTDEVNQASRILRVHRQTEAFQNSARVLGGGGTLAEERQLGQAMGWGEVGIQRLVDAIARHNQAVLDAAIRRIDALQKQMENGSNFAH